MSELTDKLPPGGHVLASRPGMPGAGKLPSASLAGASRNHPGALVLGGTHGSLAVARSLGRRGIRVWLVERGRGIAGVSRFVEKRLTWPESGESVDWLLELAGRHHLADWVLFPAGDSEVRLVASNHDRLASVFRLTTQPWTVLEQAQDKTLLYANAARLGLDTPARFAPSEAMPQPDRFPVVIKPAAREERNALTMAKAWRAGGAAEFERRYGEAISLMPRDRIVVQELIPGGGETQFSYAGLWQDGEPVASLTALRLRQYPIEFGFTSTFVQTISSQPVEEAAERLLRSLRYHGLAEVEFKYDTRDGRYKILDVNTRMWSWIALGEPAGVDFPNLTWDLACGRAVAPVRAKSGVTWRHASRDVVAGFHEIRLGRIGLRSYAASLRQPGTAACFAADDWLPGLLDVPMTAGRMLARLVRQR